MQTKWLEDLIALSRTGSLTRAAEQRHVTHPAFGRRIRTLEAWAGAPLVERRGTSVRLTPQGEKLLGFALQMVPAMDQARSEIGGTAGDGRAETVTLATGRTLARTVAADDHSVGMSYLESVPRRMVTLYLPLSIIVIVLLFPFYWMFTSSLKDDPQVYTIPPVLVPSYDDPDIIAELINSSLVFFDH